MQLSIGPHLPAGTYQLVARATARGLRSKAAEAKFWVIVRKR